MTAKRDWIQEIFDERGEVKRPEGLEPFAIRKATASQEEAIRGLAAQAGFEDLRGFWAWTKSADLDYYDLIKIASPE